MTPASNGNDKELRLAAADLCRKVKGVMESRGPKPNAWVQLAKAVERYERAAANHGEVNGSPPSLQTPAGNEAVAEIDWQQCYHSACVELQRAQEALREIESLTYHSADVTPNTAYKLHGIASLALSFPEVSPPAEHSGAKVEGGGGVGVQAAGRRAARDAMLTLAGLLMQKGVTLSWSADTATEIPTDVHVFALAADEDIGCIIDCNDPRQDAVIRKVRAYSVNPLTNRVYIEAELAPSPTSPEVKQ